MGKHLKDVREDRGMSQEEFADFCDLDTRQIGRIERAETNSTISILKKIADKLNMPVSKLLDL
ncbi:helix-turn-helix domain-containing protein [Sphingobacterium chuzhouense]|uniref:helix-turn-helix domain-containing protein n=1 Tax=Sphingobacterium chuzhouense TaxID=1742264 RepID=UPI001CC1F294|nr:helix-turn-helix transcriptional regulator [Sphingobacterium chuzhouense]